MAPERSLEDWAPVLGQGVTLEEVVDLAFDYRGDVTIELADGGTLVGYLFNRDREASPPYVEVVGADGASRTIPYAEIRVVRFTGRDTAAGTSWQAWKERKAAAKAAGGA
ncbi:MAG: hypothetical protein ACRELS_16430 [Candidatus Rokuibacteriota bacterium]